MEDNREAWNVHIINNYVEQERPFSRLPWLRGA